MTQWLTNYQTNQPEARRWQPQKPVGSEEPAIRVIDQVCAKTKTPAHQGKLRTGRLLHSTISTFSKTPHTAMHWLRIAFATPSLEQSAQWWILKSALVIDGIWYMHHASITPSIFSSHRIEFPSFHSQVEASIESAVNPERVFIPRCSKTSS